VHPELKKFLAKREFGERGVVIRNMGAQLGRQRGGTGTRGGSGEGNTEAMKRHLREQERHIMDKLKSYEGQHAEQRKNRSRNDFKTVALVGYTNAGKT
jgi:GTP-binding protein HflX